MPSPAPLLEAAERADVAAAGEHLARPMPQVLVALPYLLLQMVARAAAELQLQPVLNLLLLVCLC